MKANTALCFVLAGAALALVSLSSSVIGRRIGQGCAGILLLVALLTLGEQLTAFDLGIDELLVRDPDTPRDLNPGRMALVTSLGFLMAGLCISLSPLAARSLAPSRLARALAYAVRAVGSIGILSYALDIEFLYASDAFGSVAAHTAAGFLVLGAVLLALAQAGTGAQLSERRASLGSPVPASCSRWGPPGLLDSRRRSLPIELNQDLREMHFGIWEGRTAADLAAIDSEALSRFWQDPFKCTPPGAETLSQLEARTLGTLKAVMTRYRHQRLLLITHGGPIRILLCQALGKPIEKSLQIEVQPASLHRLCGHVNADGTMQLRLRAPVTP